MIEWLAVRADHRDEVARALGRAWKGAGATVADVVFPGGAKISFVSPGMAVARRAARWPELLADWREIYEEKLFPTDNIPVLAEEASALGAEALAAFAEPGLARASVGWYRKGVLAEYEHVGRAQVAWTPEEGLGRPFDGGRRTMGAMATKKLAEVLGASSLVNTLERLEKTAKAVGEALLAHGFLRLLGEEPPPMDELAGKVAAAERAIQLPP